MKIKVIYTEHNVEEVDTDHTTLEAFANEKFGSAYDAFVEGGGRIEGFGADESDVDPDAPDAGGDA